MERVNGRLLLIGAGPLESRLRNRTREMGHPDRVVFLGERSDWEVVQFLHACDVFVLPSVQRSEAFGIVQLEAMACGRALVSTAIGTGTTFVNQHGKTGWVVPPDDPRRLAGAIRHLLDHPEARAAFGAAGRQRVRSDFSADRMTEQTLSVYREVLSQDAPSGVFSVPVSIPKPIPPPPATPVREPVTVLRAISRLNIGGPSIHVRLLSQGLDHRRFRTVLVTGRISSTEGSMDYLFDNAPVRPVVVRTLQREISPLADWLAFIELYRMIGRERPDIVHTHTAKAGTSARVAAFLFNRFKRGRILAIHTFHGHVFEGYFSRPYSWLFVNIERALAKHSSAIVAISESQRRDLVERFRIAPAEKVRTIPLGFHLEPFLRAGERKGHFRERLGVPEDAVLIGTIGRLVPVKNHRLFLEAAAGFCRRNPGIPAVFVVIGDGELRDKLERQIETLGLRSQVRFLGWERDVPAVYADLDVLGLTSVNEGTPVSLIEAMAAGVPVLATAVGGVRDLLGVASPGPSPGRPAVSARGLVCRPGDRDGFVAGLEFLLRESPERRAVRVSNARRYVERRYGAERLVRDTENLYRQLLRERECRR
jgi:glycosyltransferase involved in cell wall biosynthesis